ncbi:MAG TPA: GNAT family protein [Pyrinomonadaceae bacterium]
MNFWQGKKVRLRGVEPSDAATFTAWNLDSEMARGIDYVWVPVSQSFTVKWLAEESQKRLEDGSFRCVIEDLSGTPVGWISTHDCNTRNGTFAYALGIACEHRRKGYDSEAIELILKYYFEELRYQKVTASVHGHNESSVRLHEGRGFTREGTLRRMVYTKGEYFDLHYYGMTKEEWEKWRLGK